MTKHSVHQKQLAAELAGQTTAKEAAALLKLADELQAMPQLKRSPAAKHLGWQGIEERIHAARRPFWKSWKPYALAPALLLIALLVTVPLSQDAIPGNATYGIKRASESVQLALAFSPSHKADLCSMYMKRRANELAQLPAARANGTTVQNLSSAILDEAREFENFAKASGPNQARLFEQRKRDAHYVIAALQATHDIQQTSEQKAAIAKTIQVMQGIIDQA